MGKSRLYLGISKQKCSIQFVLVSQSSFLNEQATLRVIICLQLPTP